jgi:hypothetical protein
VWWAQNKRFCVHNACCTYAERTFFRQRLRNLKQRVLGIQIFPAGLHYAFRLHLKVGGSMDLMFWIWKCFQCTGTPCRFYVPVNVALSTSAWRFSMLVVTAQNRMPFRNDTLPIDRVTVVINGLKTFFSLHWFTNKTIVDITVATKTFRAMLQHRQPLRLPDRSDAPCDYNILFLVYV